MELVIKRIACLLIASTLSGCTMVGTYMSPQDPAPKYNINGKTVRTNYVQLTPTWTAAHSEIPSYYVGPYDILNVIVWDHPELTTPATQMSTPAASGFLVNAQGYITFPYGGTFKVSGLRISQIGALIAQRISKYIRNPQVSVRVAVFRSEEAQILGETAGVQKTIPLNDKPTTLMDALNSAGGTAVMTADTAHIYVIRGDITHLSVYGLNVKSPQMMMAAQQFYLQNNDIIYIPPLPITNWNRVISQLLPSISAVSTAQTIQATVKSVT